MNVRRTFSLTLLLLLPVPFIAQRTLSMKGKIDSLIALQKEAKKNCPEPCQEDTVQAYAFNAIAAILIANEPLQALNYAKNALDLSKNNNFQRGMQGALNTLGLIYTEQGNLPEALACFIKSLDILEHTNDKQTMAYTYNNIGLIYKRQNNLTEALKNQFRSLAIKQELNDKKGMGASYNNIGEIFRLQDKPKEALNYYSTSLAYYQEVGDKSGISDCYNNIGIIYDFHYKDYPSALKYYNSSMKLSHELNDLYGVAGALVNIGYVYQCMKKFDTAFDYFNQGLVLSKSLDYKEAIIESYDGIYSNYLDLKDYKNAYKYHLLYTQYKDSVLNESSGKQIAEMQTKYETEKKEKEIVLQKSELEKKGIEIKQQTTQKLAFAGGFGLMLLLALVVFRSYKQKQKANILLSVQKQEIETKNTELENANIVIHEKSELLQESLKDITDSITYGSYIQQAILPEPELFNRIFPSAFILYKPRDIVSGDFYQVAENDESVYLLTADCTGHGVPGAFMSILGATLFNDALHLKRPDLILAGMRNGIVKALKQNTEIGGRKEGMDCSLIRINPAKQILEIAAANNPVYIVRQGELIKMEPDNMPVGISEYGLKPFALQRIPLHPGDMLYALTDGYVDQFGGPRGKKFKTGQLKPLLAEIAEKPLAEQKAILAKNLNEWKGTNDQVDDISLIGIRI